MKLGTKERLILYGQMTVAIFLIIIAGLLITGRLTEVSAFWAFVAATLGVGALFVIWGNHR